ncbi:hypothetical protein S245_023386 [Arachis hypogaea]
MSAQLRFRRRPSRSGASCHRLVVVLQVSNPSPHSPIAASTSGLRLLSRASAAVPRRARRLVAFVRCAQPLSLTLYPDCSDRRHALGGFDGSTMVSTIEVFDPRAKHG